MQSAIFVLAATLVATSFLMPAPAPANATPAAPEIAAAKKCMAGYVWDKRAQKCRKIRRGSY